MKRGTGQGLRVGGALALGLLAGCGGEQGYYPLPPGRVWEYRATTEILGESEEYRHVRRVGSRAEQDGRQLVVLTEQAAHRSFLVRDASGLKRVGRRPPGEAPEDDDPPVLQLPVDPQPGDSWRVTSRLRLVESKAFGKENKLYYRYLPVTLEYRVEASDAVVATPAGRFEDCLLVTASGRTAVPVDRNNAKAEIVVGHQEWYAPGVGLVRATRSEEADSPFLQSGRWDLELLRVYP